MKGLLRHTNWFRILTYRLQFQLTPILQEIQIDSESTLQWCPDFINKEEANGLFDHLMKGLYNEKRQQLYWCLYRLFLELNFEHTQITMYGKPIHLVNRGGICSLYALLLTVASPSIVVRRWGISRQRTVSETKATCLDITYANVKSSTWKTIE